MNTFTSAITETLVPSRIFDWSTGGMVDAAPIVRRHYTISSCDQHFTVLSVYGEGEYDLIVHVIGGRDFVVGSDETPTIDAAVAAAVADASALGLTVGITEQMTSARQWARIDAAHAEIDATIAATQLWED